VRLFRVGGSVDRCVGCCGSDPAPEKAIVIWPLSPLDLGQFARMMQELKTVIFIFGRNPKSAAAQWRRPARSGKRPEWGCGTVVNCQRRNFIFADPHCMLETEETRLRSFTV